MFENEMSPALRYSNLALLHDRTVRYIIVSGALLVGAIAVGTVMMAGVYRDRALADSERELNNTALILSEEIDRTFRAADLIESNLVQNIESLAIGSEDDYALQMSGKDMNLKLKEKANGLIHIDNILVVDFKGNLLNSSGEWPTSKINVADRSYFQKLKFDAQLLSFISQPLQGRVSGAWSVFLARKIKAPDGAFRGLVIGAIELSYFETLFGSIALGDGSSIALYRSDGVVLARYPHKEAILGQIFAPVIEAFKDSNGGAIRFNTPLEGKDRLLAAHGIAHYPLLVSAAVDTDAALADWKNETEMFFGTAFGAVLAVGLMFLLIVRQVAQTNNTSRNTLSIEKQRLYTAINSMSQGLILFDSSEQMVVCNDRYLAMYRLSGEVMRPGCTFQELLEHGKKAGSFSGDVAEYRSHLLANLTESQAYEIERKTSDGRLMRVVSCPVKGGGWVSTHEDTTERKRLEQEWHRDRAALRDSEQMAQEIIAGSLDGFIQINDPGEVVEWNPRAEEIFGWSRHEAVGKHLTDLYLPEATRYREINEQLRVADPASKRGVRGKFDAVHKDGRRIRIEVATTAIRWRDSLMFNCFVRDLTETIAVEEALRQSQRIESIGQLTGGIAHDFNNLLTIIVGNAELLVESLSEDRELQPLAETTMAAAERGAELVARLLAFARQQPLEPKATDINKLVAGMDEILRRTLGGQVNIQMVCASALWAASVDASQLENALLNLSINAHDAMPDGGMLTIETANVEVDHGYADQSSHIAPGDYVTIMVTDTGVGMPPEVIARAFDPFFTTKDVGKGSGLGLSMVFGFAAQSKGHVKIYSEVGYGTSVKLYLPRATAAPQLSKPRAEDKLIPSGSEKILYVEDDERVSKHVTAQLKSLGYRVVNASSGLEAMGALEHTKDFDLLFTDIMMPGGMNGRQLADRARELRPSLSILFTSGFSEGAIIHQGRLESGTQLLPKPFRTGDLARKIRQLLDSHEPGMPLIPPS